MFTKLPPEIRLLIWEAVLHQPRIVQINMRLLPTEPGTYGCRSSESDDERPGFECLCLTTIPVLLHLCTETRALALAYYELTFGRANAPVLRPRSVYKPHGFSCYGRVFEWVIESNESEVAKYAPKIYFNFEHDTLLFGQELPQRGEDSGLQSFRGFPYGKHFDFEQLQRLESLASSINRQSNRDSGGMMLAYLNHQVRSGSFQRLKKLYLCVEADDVDPSHEVELVDLRKKLNEEERNSGAVQEFVDRWRSTFKGEGVMLNSVGTEELGLSVRTV